MKKIYIAFGIFLFFFLTIVVLFTDSNAPVGQINLFSKDARIANKSNYEFSNSDTNAQFQDVDINSSSSLNSSKVNVKNTNTTSNNDLNLKVNNQKVQNSYYPKLNSPDIYKKNAYVDIKNKKEINKSQDTFSINDIYLNPKDMEKIQNAGFNKVNNISQQDLKNVAAILNEPEIKEDKYDYENIDWNTWKSRLINKITDDSAYIKELDYYPLDTPIYYSFNVHKDGSISDVVVISIVVVDSDRKKLAELIKSYANKSIVRFPKGTNRTKVNLSSIMLLSNEVKHSKPSDFNDYERVKVKM